MATTIFSAPDIECGGCANAIKKALGTLPGVAGVDVDIENKRVAVTHDAGAAPDTALTAALDRAGFPATVIGVQEK